MFNKLKEFYSEDYKLTAASKLQLIFLVFVIGAVSGWIYEEIFYCITEKLLENRGFLFGPYLPVYGFGAVFMLLLLERFRKSPVVVFVASALVTGVLEYITGYLMWSIWQHRWWDYTGLFLNIDGYVCLRSVTTFAIGGLLLIYIIKPTAAHYFFRLKQSTRAVLCISVCAVMVIDFVISLILM